MQQEQEQETEQDEDPSKSDSRDKPHTLIIRTLSEFFLGGGGPSCLLLGGEGIEVSRRVRSRVPKGFYNGKVFSGSSITTTKHRDRN